MTERMIRTGGAELATQTYGERTHPPVPPHHGRHGVHAVVAGRLLRSSGRPRPLRHSLRPPRYRTLDHYPVGEPGYTFDDMVEDAIRVLGAYAVPAAHVVGMSLGGMIGQVAALKHASRVLSLTAISSSPVGADSSQLPSVHQGCHRAYGCGGSLGLVRSGPGDRLHGRESRACLLAGRVRSTRNGSGRSLRATMIGRAATSMLP